MRNELDGHAQEYHFLECYNGREVSLSALEDHAVHKSLLKTGSAISYYSSSEAISVP